MAMVKLPTECDVLARHVIVCYGNIPGFELITRIFREIWSARGGSGPVNRGQQHEVSAWIINLAATNRDAIAITMKPPAVIDHVPEEALLIGDNLTLGILPVARAIHPATSFAASVSRHAESHLVQEALRVVVILQLNAVIGVVTCAIRNTQSVFASSIVVGQKGKPFIRSVQNLTTQPQPAVESRI